MAQNEIHAVTGALGYSGKYIAQRLIIQSHKVITITNSVNRPNPFGNKIEVLPFNFDAPDKLTKSLEGVSVLYNTYWVRFNAKTFQHSVAVDNTQILFEAAKKAGVKRIVHTSITNPSEDSHLEYFNGKAILEKALVNSGIPHTILRPGVIFGKEDILINNIAWMLRKLPLVGVFGDGNYKLQPIHVEDFADLAVAEGANTGNHIINAVGPETFTYRELVQTIGEIIGKKKAIISVPDSFGYMVGWIIGQIVGDKVITRPEIEGLKANLLYVTTPSPAKRKLTDWLRENKNTVGAIYANEMARRVDRSKSYI